jgi:hypothetical protein
MASKQAAMTMIVQAQVRLLPKGSGAQASKASRP